LWNIVEAAFRQGDINHITGDIHYLAALLRKRRTVLTIHDCVSIAGTRGFRHWIYKLAWYEMPMRRSAIVVAISEATRCELESFVPTFAGRILVIPDPVAAGFAPSPKTFEKRNPVILHIGTARHKNIERVAQALQGVPCRMEIVGTLHREQIDALKKFGIEYSSSSRLSDSEMTAKYRAADIVEFCSTYEGFGMPILEANATGRPVVTSSLEPMASVAGGAACLVDPYDPGSIRAGILRLMDDDCYRDELVGLGFENVKRFNAANIAECYAAVYRNLSRQNENRGAAA
jgi:glycosyltransferase involved in cell wall biosynthesis